MAYRSDIRIILSTKGYEELSLFVEDYLKNNDKDNNTENLLNYKIDIANGNESICFGWDYIKWYESENYIDVNAVMEGLEHLKENDFSVRYARLGESYDDYEENNYDGKKDENIELDYIQVNREFDDEYMSECSKTEYEDENHEIT
ncbi:MAG: hypothetical protein R3Y21_03830 [Mycoplasmatota bacterium]